MAAFKMRNVNDILNDTLPENNKNKNNILAFIVVCCCHKGRYLYIDKESCVYNYVALCLLGQVGINE